MSVDCGEVSNSKLRIAKLRIFAKLRIDIRNRIGIFAKLRIDIRIQIVSKAIRFAFDSSQYSILRLILAKIDTEVCSARSHGLGKYPGYLLLDRPVEALHCPRPYRSLGEGGNQVPSFSQLSQTWAMEATKRTSAMHSSAETEGELELWLFLYLVLVLVLRRNMPISITNTVT